MKNFVIVLNQTQHAKFKAEVAKRRMKLIEAASEAVDLWLTSKRKGKTA